MLNILIGNTAVFAFIQAILLLDVILMTAHIQSHAAMSKYASKYPVAYMAMSHISLSRNGHMS